MPDVEYLNLTGSGMITGDNIEGEKLRVELTGSGLIDLRGLNLGLLDALITGSGEMIFWGNATDADLDITGSGMIKAFHLECSGMIKAFHLESVNCIANISGSGNMEINVEKQLNAFISGSGSIYYQGNPSVSTTITGSGAVISAN